MSSSGPSGGSTPGIGISPSADTAGIRAPNALRGWADLRNSMNRHLPGNIYRANKVLDAAGRTLRKVK